MEDQEKGREESLKNAIMALKGIVDPTVIAERFKNVAGSGYGHLGH